MTEEELRAELRKEKARCVTHCGTWNREDRDCEIYGDYHPSPANCPYYIGWKIEKRDKGA